MVLLVAGCQSEPEPVQIEESLYALVQTIDGVAFHTPLGPSPVAVTGPFNPSLLGLMRVALETTDAAGNVAVVATFDAGTSPARMPLVDQEVYFVNVPFDTRARRRTTARCGAGAATSTGSSASGRARARTCRCRSAATRTGAA